MFWIEFRSKSIMDEPARHFYRRYDMGGLFMAEWLLTCHWSDNAQRSTDD